MGMYRKRSVVVEAITFDELVEYGKANGANIVNGMPWSFDYKGHPITHENDQCYLIPTMNGSQNFTPDDMLLTTVEGETYPCNKGTFDYTFERVSYGVEHTIELEKPVFPSTLCTISVAPDEDYGGAHNYQFTNCLGFENGETQYDSTMQAIQFVHKSLDGTMTPGLQSEQLLIALIDRTQKLDARFPCDENKVAIEALQIALEAFESRIKNRMQRGVMGELKK